MATYKKYTDENGNTIYEEINENQFQQVQQDELQQIRQRSRVQSENEAYWDELDRRNKETRKANLKIKLFWLTIAAVGLLLTAIPVIIKNHYMLCLVGLFIMSMGAFFVRNKYSEY